MDGPVSGVVFSKSDLATGSSAEGIIRFWDTNTVSLKDLFKGFNAGVCALGSDGEEVRVALTLGACTMYYSCDVFSSYVCIPTSAPIR